MCSSQAWWRAKQGCVLRHPVRPQVGPAKGEAALVPPRCCPLVGAVPRTAAAALRTGLVPCLCRPVRHAGVPCQVPNLTASAGHEQEEHWQACGLSSSGIIDCLCCTMMPVACGMCCQGLLQFGSFCHGVCRGGRQVAEYEADTGEVHCCQAGPTHWRRLLPKVLISHPPTTFVNVALLVDAATAAGAVCACHAAPATLGHVTCMLPPQHQQQPWHGCQGLQLCRPHASCARGCVAQLPAVLPAMLRPQLQHDADGALPVPARCCRTM